MTVDGGGRSPGCFSFSQRTVSHELLRRADDAAPTTCSYIRWSSGDGRPLRTRVMEARSVEFCEVCAQPKGDGVSAGPRTPPSPLTVMPKSEKRQRSTSQVGSGENPPRIGYFP